MRSDLEIVSVNYCTPEFIDRLIDSVRKIEGDYPIRIIDGSDTEQYQMDVLDVCGRHDNVAVELQGWNIHHGRGMDHALMTSSYEWVLIIDSDNYLLQPIIDKLFIGKDIVGKNVKDYKRDNISYNYYHPSFLLVNVPFYRKLAAKGAKFLHDGAPCWYFYKYIHQNRLQDHCIDIFAQLGINYRDYIGGEGRGTRAKFNFKLRAGKDVF